MKRLPVSERLTAALAGAVFGAIIGLALAWLVGVYSNNMGPGQVPVSFSTFALVGAASFGGIGLVFGASVGTLLGHVVTAIFDFEGSRRDIP
jgi:hypothetical protein